MTQDPPPPDSVRSTGISARQRSPAFGQRVWNSQPRGRLIRLGISPSMGAASIRLDGSGCGIPRINASVYGCAGARNTASQGPRSTIRPRYMIARLSQMWRIAGRLWLTSK